MSVLERVHLSGYANPDRNGRGNLEREIQRLLVSSPQVPDTDGRLIRIKTLSAPASLLSEWQDRPRMRGSQDRMSQDEYQEALRTVPWFAPRYELRYEEPSFHDLASLVLSSRPRGIFGEVTSAKLILVHTSQPEAWVYNLTSGRKPELSYWTSPLLDLSQKKGEQKIRARGKDLAFFSRLLSTATPQH